MILYKKYFSYLFEGQNQDDAERFLVKAGLITSKNDQLYKDLDELDKTQTKKHLPQLVLYYIETKDLNRIKIVYDDFINSRLKDTDIRKYKTLQEFENEVHRVKPVESDLGMKNIKVSGTPVYKDSKIEIFKGNSQKACVQYGDGYSFCISDKIISRNLFYSYRFRDNLRFTVYFVRFLYKNSSKVDGKFIDPLHLIVLHIGTDDAIMWTGADNGHQGNNTVSITKKELLKKFPELEQAFNKNILVFDEYTEEEEAILKHVYNKTVDDESFINFPNNVKNAYISMGKKLSDKMWDVCNEEMRMYYINVAAVRDLSEHQKRTASRDVLKNYDRVLVIRTKQKIKMKWGGKLTNDELVIANGNDNIKNDLLKRDLEVIKQKIKFKNENNDVDDDVELKNIGLFYKFPIQFGKIAGDFTCYNNNLITLEGAPDYVDTDFDCSGNNLTTLEGGPKSVGRDFKCYSNNLTTLEGAPDYVGRDFKCYSNNLITLEGGPKSVGKNFECENNNLTTLEGGPKSVGRDFKCYSNNLTTLEGAPDYVGRDFECENNNLTSLEGGPKSVGGVFFCNQNNLTTLEGAPKSVGGSFYCHAQKNGHKFTEAEVRAVCNVRGKVII